MSQPRSNEAPAAGGTTGSGLSDMAALDRGWDDAYRRIAEHPWTNGVLPVKTVELIAIGLNAACTTLNEAGVRKHIQAAFAAGATSDEIAAVLKMAALLAIHSCSLGAPLLLDAMAASGLGPDGADAAPATPACDQMRALGQWNAAWDPFFALDPAWTEAFMAAGVELYAGGVLSPKDVELLSIAFDASITHMYAPGTRRHIDGASALGATPAEIMAVLQTCVAFGAEALNLGAPILTEELERFEERSE
jgi:alkylhydroperoxidase/carboxymuconolactone decarboxylase family protein YurZ